MLVLAFIFGTRGKIDKFDAIKLGDRYWFFADFNGWTDVTVEEAKARFVAGAK